MSTQQENAAVEERWKEFWRDHQNFDSPWVRDSLATLSEQLPCMFTLDAVKVGLKQLYAKSGVKLEPYSYPDIESLSASNLSVLPIFKLALALRAYAYYGLKLETGTNFDVEEFLDIDTPLLPGGVMTQTPSKPLSLALRAASLIIPSTPKKR